MHSIKTIASWALTLVLLMIPGVALSAPAVTEIQGTAKDALGRPLSGVSLTLKTPQEKIAGETKSSESTIFLDKTQVTLDTLASTLKPMLEGPDASVIVAADTAAPYGVTVNAMMQARAAGAQHFLIAVKHIN